MSTAPEFEELQALAGHLSAGCAGVKYGSPPHIGDAIQLIVESRNSISVATINACWSHADCLLVHIFPKVLTSQANGKRSDDDPYTQIRNALSDQLHPATVQDLLSAPSEEMISEWIHLEENPELESFDTDEEEETEGKITPSEQVSVTTELLPLLYTIHKCGVKLSDSFLINVSRELTLHFKKRSYSTICITAKHKRQKLTALYFTYVLTIHCVLFIIAYCG